MQITYSKSLLDENVTNVLVNDKVVGEVILTSDQLFKARKFADASKMPVLPYDIIKHINQYPRYKPFQTFEAAVAYLTTLGKSGKDMKGSDIQIGLL